MPQNTKGQPKEEAGRELNPTASGETVRETVAGKGRPTPTRKEKVEARKRPLVVNDRGEAKKREREAMQQAREQQRIGYSAGIDKFLPARDRGVQRRYVRDYVDARTSIGEFMLPVLAVVIVVSLVAEAIPMLSLVSIIMLWAFLLIAVTDVLILGRLVRKKLEAKFGADKVETGLRWYAGMRALQLRQMRLPKPQVKRGHWPA